VEPDGKGCKTCGHGEVYSIVLSVPGEEETQLSESFCENNPIAESAKEHAEDLVENLNFAYEEGRKSREPLLRHLKAAVDSLDGSEYWLRAAMEAIKEDELAS
jgi:hypothetical protein